MRPGILLSLALVGCAGGAPAERPRTHRPATAAEQARLAWDVTLWPEEQTLRCVDAGIDDCATWLANHPRIVMKATDRFDRSTPEVRVPFLASDDASAVHIEVRSSGEPSPTFLRLETINAQPAVITLRVEQDAGAPPPILGSDESIELACHVGDSGACWLGSTCMPGTVFCRAIRSANDQVRLAGRPDTVLTIGRVRFRYTVSLIEWPHLAGSS